MLRVYGIEELFAAAETLTRARRIHGDRLAILTNGAGPGVMATDVLLDGGGALARLAPETIARLDAVLPPAWSRANPVDILGDASGELYSAAFGDLARCRRDRFRSGTPFAHRDHIE